MNNILQEVNRLRVLVKRFLDTISTPFDFLALVSNNHTNKYKQKPSLEEARDALINSLNLFNQVVELIRKFKATNDNEFKSFIRWSKLEDVFNDSNRNNLKSILKELSSNNSNNTFKKIDSIVKQCERIFDKINDNPSSILKLFKSVSDESIISSNQDGLVIVYNNMNNPSILETSKILSDWHKILLSFARIDGNSSDSYYIIKVEKGSLIVTIGAVLGLVVTFGKFVNDMLTAISKVIEIKKQVLELKKLENDILSDMISNMEDSLKFDWDKAIKASIDRLIESSDYKGDDIEEVRNGLVLSSKKVKEFLTEDGGDVKFLLTEKGLEHEEVLELKTQISNTKKILLERQQKLLSEYMPNKK